LTQEQVALRTCTTALTDSLKASEGVAVTQTQMIGKRPSGWLVRGLSAQVGGLPARNYECLASTSGSSPPELVYLRLCAAGKSPWGCPVA
jgi:hypothetical protein